MSLSASHVEFQLIIYNHDPPVLGYLNRNKPPPPNQNLPNRACAARRAQRLLHQFLGLRDTLQRQIRQGLEALATEKPLA